MIPVTGKKFLFFLLIIGVPAAPLFSGADTAPEKKGEYAARIFVNGLKYRMDFSDMAVIFAGRKDIRSLVAMLSASEKLTGKEREHIDGKYRIEKVLDEYMKRRLSLRDKWETSLRKLKKETPDVRYSDVIVKKEKNRGIDVYKVSVSFYLSYGSVSLERAALLEVVEIDGRLLITAIIHLEV